MSARAPHPWPRTVAEARAIQEALRSRVIARDRIGRVRHVAGVDASYDRTAGITRAAVAVLALPGLGPVAQRVARRRLTGQRPARSGNDEPAGMRCGSRSRIRLPRGSGLLSDCRTGA